MSEPLKVKFVASEGLVWQGEATSVIVRTTEGDLGVLAGHAPLMALLVPHGAEVLTVDGVRHILAVDSGIISVFNDNVSVISAYGSLANEISVDEARIELAALTERVDRAEASEHELRDYHRLESQIKAALKYQKLANQR